jgi:undecaprenyl-diphosphatase
MPIWFLRLSEFDERLLHAVVLRRRTPLNLLARTLTHLADAPVAIGLAAGLVLGAVPGLRGAGATAAFALGLSHLLVQILKRFFSRPRPRLPVGITSLMRSPDRFSFPSGHAAAGFSITLPLAMALPPGLGTLVLALGFGIGLSRCYLGVHYPGDVVAGWTLATLSVALAGPALGLL